MAQRGQPSQPHGSAVGTFLTTHWSTVMRAGDSRSPEAAAALEKLFRTYWYPLYVFVRRKGYTHEEASDSTQSFIARFLEKNYLHSVDAKYGKFRTFLLTSLTHFLANEWDRSQAQRRGGGCQIFSLDSVSGEERYRLEPVDEATPSTIFERRWAQAVMAQVLDRLAAETNAVRFESLKGFLLEDKGAVSYGEVASRLGMSIPAVTSAIFRMRARFRAILYEEIAKTVDSPEMVEEEIRHLITVLSG